MIQLMIIRIRKGGLLTSIAIFYDIVHLQRGGALLEKIGLSFSFPSPGQRTVNHHFAGNYSVVTNENTTTAIEKKIS